MEHMRADDVDELRLSVGERVELESLRQPLAPPYLMLMPFVEAPDSLEVERQDRLDEDGVHGSVFQLRGAKPGKGELVVGFRDLRTNKVTHRKGISVAVDGSNR